ncbi:predicted protein [Sclerotinia sclerotiorum 1980 UF-70]|uniref:Uncharacterized protein n=1 Tax=Sclerotinia sclerotiorum (strain ATCC 18683 / 1980 / Ss-1) TaxID=665079 RepID=A7ETB2_SCLS1|nr:predicted protein [Sclerotinia sclerotiorum 1980 UF-70]EDN92704.1 predicted protein [Sclerotinia sclerotiorum 1980 UF-70]
MAEKWGTRLNEMQHSGITVAKSAEEVAESLLGF